MLIGIGKGGEGETSTVLLFSATQWYAHYIEMGGVGIDGGVELSISFD